MTVAGHKRTPTRLEIAKQHVEHALGPKIAKRLDTHKDGTFYISAGSWARLSAWFVDVLVCTPPGSCASTRRDLRVSHLSRPQRGARPGV
jgi:hypothetical protein